MSNQLMTLQEVADTLQVSVVTVRRLKSQHRLPHVKVAGQIRFTPGDVMQYVQQNRHW